jgi:uncharacterized protein involved in exopolysaccharide biosynthesis
VLDTQATPPRSGPPYDSVRVGPDPATPWTDDEFDLRRYATALRRGWVTVVAGAAIGAIAGLGYASTRPVVFTAATTMTVTYPAGQGAAPTTPQALTVILRNTSLAAEVIAETGLDEPPASLTAQRFVEDALTVEALAGTNVIRVAVQLPDPKLAADASRRLSLKAVELTRSLNDLEGTAVQERLKEHLTAAAGRLAAAEKELLTFQQRAQIELLKEDTNAILAERRDLLRLAIEIESEKAGLSAAEQEIKRQDRVLSIGRDVSAEEALRTTRGGAAAASIDPLDLSNPFLNPVYQTLDFQIATSRTRLAALEQKRRQLVDVRKLGGDGLARLSELYARQMDMARLQSAYDLYKRIHTDLSVRYEESRTTSLGNSPLLQLVDTAVPPDRPVSRRRGFLTGVGMITGLLAASLVVMMREGGAAMRPTS